jgi:universal stress protein A
MMMRHPLVLCAVDFSDASRGALRYAAALGEHFSAAVTVLTVSEPAGAANNVAARPDGEREMRICRELEAFVHGAFPGRTPQVANLSYLVTIGAPAAEILHVANQQHADILVMGAHGAGRPGQPFGSTVEDVLRQMTVPVIVTPDSDPGPESVEDWHDSVKSIVVPVDLSANSAAQVQIGRGLAVALDRPLVLAHVLEANASRREMAQCQLARLIATLPASVTATATVRAGDPATEIARLAKQSDGIVVMGLYASAETKRHIGHVTYRVLCQKASVVVAWPPSILAAQHPLAREPVRTRTLA